MPDVLQAILDQAVAGPDRLAVRDLDRELTYAALRDEAAQLGAGLAARGVVEGDRVGVLLPNSVDFVSTALACLWIGAIFVPLAVTDPVARLATIVGDCAPAAVVTADTISHELGELNLDEGRIVSLTELDRATSPQSGPIAASPRPAYAIYTSGTTNTPKGVLIGNRAFGAAVQATSNALGLGLGTRTLCVSPFHFDGSFGTLFPTLYSGGAVIIRPRDALLFPRTFFNAVTKEEITYTGFSPSYLRLLLASPLLSRLSDSALDVIALGGEASSIADIRSLWAAAPKTRVFNRYGPTETTIAVTHVHLTPEVVADGTVPIGYPHPDVSFYLVDEDGSITYETERAGELFIGGSQLMDGYWGAPELTQEVLRTDVVPGETVYRSGDLVYRNNQGSYVYVDRIDRVIKRSGVRISLIELTEVIRNLDGVSAAACVPFDDDGVLGIVAFVVPDKPITQAELQKSARARLPDTMIPNRIELVEVLPLTKSSKLDERLLLSEAGLHQPQRSVAPGPSLP
jgi:D-alanine--poly(phosphoribitol) ligase subunit 1